MSAIESTGAARPSPIIGAAIIMTITFVAYFPAIWAGGFIWDDDSYVTDNRLLAEGEAGLRRIWIPRETPQYYPVVFTSFWIEHQLWGLDPTGYHVVNVLLHALNAVLVWLLAQRLKIPWAWLIGAVFAVHPVHVESVAWITERKNTLSGLFYLIAALTYLRFDEREDDRNRWGWYALALVSFLLALLSKSVTCSLPAALILMMLWQRKPMTFARLAPLAPLFVVGLILALNTATIEREHVGATGEAFDFSVADRFIIASRALLFYPAKLLWPWPIIFIYPRWTIDDSQVLQYLPLAACIAVAIVVIVLYARGMRGPFLALSFFAGTVFPALGFVNVYPMIFSFVADHFQYLASLGVIALVIGGAGYLIGCQRRMVILAAMILPVLGVITWNQCWAYQSVETIFRDTIAKNDGAFMAHNNLAAELLRQANALEERGDHDAATSLRAQAKTHLERALEIKPRYAQALGNLAGVVSIEGDHERALTLAEQALEVITARDDIQQALRGDSRPQHAPIADAFADVARFQAVTGRVEQAMANYQEAIRWSERDFALRLEYIGWLASIGREIDAAPQYEAMLRYDPENLALLSDLATIRQKQGRHAEARGLLIRAVETAQKTGDPLPVYLRLVRLFATAPDPNVRDTAQALRMIESLVQQSQRRDPALLDVLASVLAEDGQLAAAITTADEAARLADQLNMPDLARDIRQRATQYRIRSQPPAPLLPTAPPSQP